MSIWGFIANAGLVVKCVMFILLCASIASWTIIFQRRQLFRSVNKSSRVFEHEFWSGIELSELYQRLKQRADTLTGLALIAHAGLQEFTRLNSRGQMPAEAVMEGTARAMRIAHTEQLEELEHHLEFLATVGSTSPYVGLFGTVWGIMTSFQALGAAQQATIAMVAPGISEALIATAIGLFAAIPAVIAYNRYASQVEKLNTQYERFQDELIEILHRRVHSNHIAEATGV